MDNVEAKIPLMAIYNQHCQGTSLHFEFLGTEPWTHKEITWLTWLPMIILVSILHPYRYFSHLNLGARILDTCHQLFKAQHLHDTSQHHWPPRSNTLPQLSASHCWASSLRYRKPNNGHHDARSRRRQCARNHNPAKKEGGLVQICEEGVFLCRWEGDENRGCFHGWLCRRNCFRPVPFKTKNLLC